MGNGVKEGIGTGMGEVEGEVVVEDCFWARVGGRGGGLSALFITFNDKRFWLLIVMIDDIALYWAE